MSTPLSTTGPQPQTAGRLELYDALTAHGDESGVRGGAPARSIRDVMSNQRSASVVISAGLGQGERPEDQRRIAHAASHHGAQHLRDRPPLHLHFQLFA